MIDQLVWDDDEEMAGEEDDEIIDLDDLGEALLDMSVLQTQKTN